MRAGLWARASILQRVNRTPKCLRSVKRASLPHGADVFVTLEPCAHFGRTPPCVDTLVRAGVSRVVIGMPDPSSEAGGGAQRLRDAGIEVEWAQDSEPFRALNRGWLKRLETGSPLVVVKVALSLDAHPSLQEGKRAAITGASGAEVTRLLRARADAVLVGAATVSADDPALTVRDAPGSLAERQPLRVVLVRGSVPPEASRVFSDGQAPTLVILDRAASDSTVARVHSIEGVESTTGVPGLVGALQALGSRGVNEVLVEPGPRLLTALWEAAAIDVLVTVVAGGMAGEASPALYRGGADTTGETLLHRMAPTQAGIVGDVAVTEWRPTQGSADRVVRREEQRCSRD